MLVFKFQAMTQQDLINEFHIMSAELRRHPTRHEFINRVSVHRLQIHFENWGAFLAAMGIENPASRKVDATIFNRDIERHLANYTAEPKEKETYPKIAIISDIHWPFHSERVVSRFIEYTQKFNPEFIVINGDAWDCYSHAKFPRSHNVFTPREEQRLSRELNEKFWKDVKEVCPNAKCYQLLGNHDVRPMKRILEEYPEAEDWIKEKMKQLFTYDGVETIFDFRQELHIGSIVIHHGFKSGLGAHRDHNLQNSISGHTHKPGVVYRTVRGSAIWELNTGYAGDPLAKGLTYTATKITDWVQGFGIVDENGPRFIMA